MLKVIPPFAKEKTAAELLDMQPAEFRALVDDGHLPRARDLAGVKRWDTSELVRIMRGDAVDGTGPIAW